MITTRTASNVLLPIFGGGKPPPPPIKNNKARYLTRSYVLAQSAFKKVDDLPEDADYGVVFYCEETESFQINVPDEILEKMPEM